MWPRQLVAELERPFEVDAPADVPLRGGGDVERLRRRIDLEHGLAALGAVARHHRQADAVAGDRAADRQILRLDAAHDRNLADVVPLRVGDDRADFGDDAGEHVARLNPLVPPHQVVADDCGIDLAVAGAPFNRRKRIAVQRPDAIGADHHRRAEEDHLVDQVGGDQRGRDPRPALDQEPRDADLGELLQRRLEVRRRPSRRRPR